MHHSPPTFSLSKHFHQLVRFGSRYLMEHCNLTDRRGKRESSNGCFWSRGIGIIFLPLSFFSATCSPTSPSGGTVNLSWRSHSYVCPTCICMNWGTFGRSSSTWQWGPSWPCKSDSGNPWENHQTITSDEREQTKPDRRTRSWETASSALTDQENKSLNHWREHLFWSWIHFRTLLD